MITINLLPQAEPRRGSADEAAPADPLGFLRPAREQWLLAAAAAGALVLLAAAYGVTSTAARTAELEALIEREAADSIRFSAAAGRLQALEARRDTIEQRLQVIRRLDERRFVWPYLLDEVSRALPAAAWLAGLSSAEGSDGEGPSLTLQGSALSTQTLTSFLKSLESSPFLLEVTLVTSEQVVEEGVTVYRFTLEARYRRPEAGELKTVPIVASH